MAIKLGNIEIVELLIDHGADVNGTSSRGETTLAEAVILAEGATVSADIFRMLLDRGADPTEISICDDETAITRALSFNAVDAVKALVERGIELALSGGE